MNLEKVKFAYQTLQDIEDIRVVCSGLVEEDPNSVSYLKVNTFIIRLGKTDPDYTIQLKDTLQQYIKNFFSGIKNDCIKSIKENVE